MRPTAMASESTYVSRYERRLEMVVDALRHDPSAREPALPDDTARRIAVRVLHALDHIPETVR